MGNIRVAPPTVGEGQQIDPEWALQALSSFMPFVTRGYRINNINAVVDPVERLRFALGSLDKEENRAYQNFLRGTPVKYKLPTPVAAPTPATPEAPKTVDQTKVQLARQRAIDSAMLNLRSQGIDPTPFLPMINAEYDRRAATITPDDDPFDFFNSEIADSVVQAELAQRQNQFMQNFDTQFGEAADRAALPSSLLDDAISQILTEQRGGAVQQLERGKARGIYNDVGYNAGLGAIDNAMGVGRSELGRLGGSLLDKYIGDLNKIDDRAFAAYGAHPIGSSSFSLDPYIAQRNDFLNRTRTNAAGDLRGALGGRNFFDFGRIGQSAGTAQGALNLRDADVATALAERRRQNTLSRGLGSQGAF